MCQIFITLDTTNAITLLEKFFTLSKSNPLKDGYGLITKDSNDWILSKSINPPYINKEYKQILNSNFIIAHLRQIYKENVTTEAIRKEKTIENTHPFIYHNIYFMHHGDLFIEDSNNIKRFQQHYREPVFQKRITQTYKLLNTNLLNNILGNTDSEFIFHIFLQYLQNKDTTANSRYNMISSFKQTTQYINQLGFQNASNIVIVQDNYIMFSTVYKNTTQKHIKSPRLYMNKDNHTGVTICSSKIAPGLIKIKQNSIYIYNILSKKVFEYN